MSPGSYDPNLGSEILILGGDIRLRSWPNIGDSYGNSLAFIGNRHKYYCFGRVFLGKECVL